MSADVDTLALIAELEDPQRIYPGNFETEGKAVAILLCLCQNGASELRRLHALVSACEPFLKEDETPAQRIERERRDTEAMCRLYARERSLNAELLEALEWAIRQMPEPVLEGAYTDGYRKARATIAKATGRQQ